MCLHGTPKDCAIPHEKRPCEVRETHFAGPSYHVFGAVVQTEPRLEYKAVPVCSNSRPLIAQGPSTDSAGAAVTSQRHLVRKDVRFRFFFTWVGAEDTISSGSAPSAEPPGAATVVGGAEESFLALLGLPLREHAIRTYRI